jgi:hypothetical protein
MTAQQLTTAVGPEAASTNPACGQTVSGVVNLTANLNCSGDGIIVGGPNTVINMNGFSITGPGQDSSKVGIMVLGNLLAGVTFVNTQQSNVGMNNVHGNQNGIFLDGQSSNNAINANNL